MITWAWFWAGRCNCLVWVSRTLWSSVPNQTGTRWPQFNPQDIFICNYLGHEKALQGCRSLWCSWSCAPQVVATCSFIHGSVKQAWETGSFWSSRGSLWLQRSMEELGYIWSRIAFSRLTQISQAGLGIFSRTLFAPKMIFGYYNCSLVDVYLCF